MPRNGSGVYTLPAGNPVVSGTVIESTWANTTLNDLANEMTNSLARNGAGGMTAPFKLFDGTEAAPGLAFTLEPATGLYRESAGVAGFSALGSKRMSWSTTTVSVTVPVTGGAFSVQTETGTLLMQGSTLSYSGTGSDLTMQNVASIQGSNVTGVLSVTPTASGPTTGHVSIAGAGAAGGLVQVNSALAAADPGGVNIHANNAANARIYAGGDEMLRVEGSGARAVVMPLATLTVGVGLAGSSLARVNTTGTANAMYEMHVSGLVARAWYLSADSVTRFSVTNGGGSASATQVAITEQGAFNVGYDAIVTGPGQIAAVTAQGQTPTVSWFQGGVFHWSMGMSPNDAGLNIGQGNSTGFADVLLVFDMTNRTMRPPAANTANLGTAALPYATIYATNPLSPSDADLKEDIEDCAWGLDHVLALRPVTYRWRDRTRLGNAQHMGFIAQDVLKALPLAVTVGEGAPLSMNYSSLIAPLVSAVKTLHARLQAVEERQ
jgi:hypothetical protein